MRPTPLLLLPLLLAACQLSDAPPKLAGSGMDMFAPVAMRLHPLSRFVPPPATSPSQATPAPSVLEARFELTDQFGDPTKSPGTLSLQLYDQTTLLHKGALLASWNLPIDSPDANRDHWDRTTRTYLFKLTLPFPLPPAALARDHLLLSATLTLPNNHILTDELELPPK